MVPRAQCEQNIQGLEVCQHGHPVVGLFYKLHPVYEHFHQTAEDTKGVVIGHLMDQSHHHFKAVRINLCVAE